jgi:hypothetical protein
MGISKVVTARLLYNWAGPCLATIVVILFCGEYHF